jgi:hypothetical protein
MFFGKCSSILRGFHTCISLFTEHQIAFVVETKTAFLVEKLLGIPTETQTTEPPTKPGEQPAFFQKTQLLQISN